MWSNDGFVLRLPENEEPLDPSWITPGPAEFRDLVLRQLGSTAVFAAKFRECASRALLLPKRRPGTRAPLWQQRKRAADLLGVAARYATFPILLETYRECMRDVFDMPAAASILRRIAAGKDPRHYHRLDQAVAVRIFAAVLLYRQLHLRRRRAAGGTPRTGAWLSISRSCRNCWAIRICANYSMALRSMRSKRSCRRSIPSIRLGIWTGFTTYCDVWATSPKTS